MAKQRYRDFVAEGLTEGKRVDLEGGGLIRSAGGVMELVRGGRHGAADERILGSDEFVNGVLAEAEAKEAARSRLRRRGMRPEVVMERAAEAGGVKIDEVKGRGKRPGQSGARALFCKWMVDDLGYSGVAVAGMLETSKMAVSYAVRRGREIEKAKRLSLD